jgi:hypothetical protein
VSGGSEREADGPEDLTALVGSRLSRYVDLWESASAKLSSGSYHADDLVDDWFQWVGLVSRDAAAAATVMFSGLAGATGRDGGPDASEDEPGH